MPLENNTAIIIVVYNNADLLRLQVESLHRYCKDNFDVVIIDNSNIPEIAEAVKYHADDTGCFYIKTESSSQWGSGSHAFAANLSYMKLKDDYEFMFYLDHDCFPVKEFSVIDTLGANILAGIGQEKNGKTYMWPGCFMFNNAKIEKHLIDFSTNADHRLDTGGNLYKALEYYDGFLKHFNEKHVENPYFNKSFYNFYSLINDGMFMHFINGSNWSKSNDNTERINSLINVLKDLTK
jgi:hypothetical protein